MNKQSESIKIRLMAVCVVLTALIFCVPALAASDGTAEYRALIVGNVGYTDSRYVQLPACGYDADAMAGGLASGSIGFKKALLKKSLTKKALSDAVNAMQKWGADDDDVTIFYYSGHGEPTGLVGTDGGVYTFGALKKALDKVSGKVIVILDSCYSGELIGKSARSAGGNGFTSGAIAAFADAGGATPVAAKAITTGSKYHVIASSSKTQQSYAFSELYSFATLGITEAIGWSHNGPKAGKAYDALNGDANGDGLVTVSEAYNYAKNIAPEFLEGMKDEKGDQIEQDMQIYPVNSGLTLLSRVTVKAASDSTMNLKTACIAPGMTLQLDCGVEGAYWTSENSAIAAVDSATGVVTGVKANTSKTVLISARVENVVYQSKVRVLPAKYVVSALKLAKSAVNLEVGSSYTLKAKVSPSSARYKKIIWTTSDKKVATVSSSGKIKAVGKGTATITATATSGVSQTCTVTVSAAMPKSVKLDTTKVTLIPGGRELLSEKVSPSTAEDQSVTWSSSNTAVATVNEDGMVTAVKTGKATITVKTVNGKKAKCQVTVTANQSVPRSRPASRSGEVAASARKIYYKDGALCVDMWFYNRTGSTQRIPEPNPGLLVLKLKKPSKVTMTQLYTVASTVKLKNGRYTTITIKLNLEDYPKFSGLDLRGADATFEAQN